MENFQNVRWVVLVLLFGLMPHHEKRQQLLRRYNEQRGDDTLYE